ncbi:hypothetical protein [Streptomyces sp. t39]|uniref:hypothetical protein n=1 Tax=Streptomyces sp. t39 TaxID=1828156 RepID=UPI0011CDB4AB|nr:hypothetical protein [Streptomyces sp. t39]TXS46996.1 hypothetical protein EAO77_32330 [Streptomyces sp. t39]
MNTFGDESNNLPPLLRKPDPVSDPVPVAQLRGARKALTENPASPLDDGAASIVTAGAVEPMLLRKMIEAQGETAEAGLLMAKPVAGGTLYAIPPHRRFLDLDVLPDFVNQRWAHKVWTAMDVETSTAAPITYETLIDEESGEPQAVFVVRMPNRKALADAVTKSMRRTFYAQNGKNVYTESVLQQGVKEPMTLFLVRVVYDDGTQETFTVAGDGNSRLVSMWLARTGGDIDEAAAACVAAVIGSVDRSGPRRPADQRAARTKVAEMAARVRRGLAEPTLTEATRREGHTITFPAMVIVGAVTEDGSPMPDLVAARDDLVANLHVNVTAWTEGAQNTQGMQRVYRHALHNGLIDKDTYRILLGEVAAEQMHQLLGLPPHRLWSSALHQQTVLAGYRAEQMNLLIKQEFGMGKADRQRVSDHLAPMALSAYRSSERIEPAIRAFGNGGTITDAVWKQPWELSTGDDAFKVLDDIFSKAVNGDTAAVAELTVLGGTAAILDGYITRDRGSKVGVTREGGKAPFRASPNKLLAILASTHGGLSMLHSIARAHIAADPGILPKRYHTYDHEVDGVIVRDGDPVRDKVGALVTIDYEWDLVYAADPIGAEAAIAENRAALGNNHTKDDDRMAEDTRQRRILEQGIKNARKAVNTLAKMVPTRGREVFGSHEGVQMLREHLRKVDDILVAFGPERTAVLDLDDEGDGDEE